MEVLSLSPLRTGSIIWQKGPAAWVLTLVCKATYDLAPGESPLAADQDPPNEADDHWNDDETRSLRAPGDMAPLKLRADVVLVGSAFAPGGAPVRSLTARLVVNKIDKAIECWADRVVSRDGSVQEGSGFSRMPLLYERAAGGPGTSNPVGVRRDARDAYGRLSLPNLQPPGSRVTGVDTVLDPVGFGPVAARWPQRLEKLGRHAATWPPHDWNTRPVPGDVDLAHFNVAPLDQQVTVLRENERLVLENLNREHPRLMTALPGIRPCAFVEGRGGAPFRLPMHADTLWIDTDRALCTMVWRRQIPLERPDERGRVLVAMEQPGQTMTWTDVVALLPIEDDKIEIQTLIPPPGSTVAEVTAAAFRVPSVSAMLPFASDAPPSVRTVPFAGGKPRSDGGGALPFVSASPSGPAASRPLSPLSPPGAPAPPPWAVPAQAAPSAPPAVAGPLREAEEGDSDVFSVTAKNPPLPPLPPAPVAPPPVVGSAFTMGALAGSSLSLGAPGPEPSRSPWSSGAPAGPAAPAFAMVATAAAVARPEPLPPPPAPRAAEPAPAAEILELLWFESDSVPRIRRQRAWKPILTALEQQPVDRDLDDPALASEPMEMEDRREVFEILAHGSAVDAEGIDQALDAAVRKDGKFVAQLALLAGQLEFRFDELETLKATAATVGPFVTPTDEALKSAVDAAKEFLKTADELTPPSVAEGMTTRIRDAFAQTRRAVPDTHLVEQTDRALLGQRRYQKRIVFGAPHLRCLVQVEGAAVPAYLPESLAKKLPLYLRFKGRLIAEVQQQADQYETHHAALRVVALARATARRVRA